MNEEHTPIIRVDLKRFDVKERVLTEPILRTAPFLKLLGERRWPVLQQGIGKRYPDKVVMFQQGDAGAALLFILSGEVRLFSRKGVNSVELGAVPRGEVVGEAEMLQNAALRTHSAVALGDVDVVEIPREALFENERLPKTLQQFFEELAKRRSSAADELNAFIDRW